MSTQNKNALRIRGAFIFADGTKIPSVAYGIGAEHELDLNGEANVFQCTNYQNMFIAEQALVATEDGSAVITGQNGTSPFYEIEGATNHHMLSGMRLIFSPWKYAEVRDLKDFHGRDIPLDDLYHRKGTDMLYNDWDYSSDIQKFFCNPWGHLIPYLNGYGYDWDDIVCARCTMLKKCRTTAQLDPDYIIGIKKQKEAYGIPLRRRALSGGEAINTTIVPYAEKKEFNKICFESGSENEAIATLQVHCQVLDGKLRTLPSVRDVVARQEFYGENTGAAFCIYAVQYPNGSWHSMALVPNPFTLFKLEAPNHDIDNRHWQLSETGPDPEIEAILKKAGFSIADQIEDLMFTDPTMTLSRPFDRIFIDHTQGSQSIAFDGTRSLESGGKLTFTVEEIKDPRSKVINALQATHAIVMKVGELWKNANKDYWTAPITPRTKKQKQSRLFVLGDLESKACERCFARKACKDKQPCLDLVNEIHKAHPDVDPFQYAGIDPKTTSTFSYAGMFLAHQDLLMPNKNKKILPQSCVGIQVVFRDGIAIRTMYQNNDINIDQALANAMPQLAESVVWYAAWHGMQRSVDTVFLRIEIDPERSGFLLYEYLGGFRQSSFVEKHCHSVSTERMVPIDKPMESIAFLVKTQLPEMMKWMKPILTSTKPDSVLARKRNLAHILLRWMDLDSGLSKIPPAEIFKAAITYTLSKTGTGSGESATLPNAVCGIDVSSHMLAEFQKTSFSLWREKLSQRG